MASSDYRSPTTQDLSRLTAPHFENPAGTSQHQGSQAESTDLTGLPGSCDPVGLDVSVPVDYSNPVTPRTVNHSLG